MRKCLIDSIDNLNRAKSLHEIYYLKGTVNTLSDILYKFCEDGYREKLNKQVYCSINVNG